jgi:hypothetical protein
LLSARVIWNIHISLCHILTARRKHQSSQIRTDFALLQ